MMGVVHQLVIVRFVLLGLLESDVSIGDLLLAVVVVVCLMIVELCLIRVNVCSIFMVKDAGCVVPSENENQFEIVDGDVAHKSCL